MRLCLVVLLFLAACDVSYRAPNVYKMSGTVEIGGPVGSASMEILPWPNRNQHLGSATTDRKGQFRFDLTVPYAGPVVIRISKGRIIDPITFEPLEMNDDQNVEFFLPQLSNIEDIRINPWTLFASARAMAVSGKPLDAGASMRGSLEVFNKLVEKFDPSFLSTCELFSDECLNEPKRLLFSLSQLGMFRLAEEKGWEIFDFIRFVNLDLSDGILDGRAGKEELSFPNGEKADSFLLRFELASAIDHYLRSLDVSKSALVARIDPLLDGPDGFFASISSHFNENLCPTREGTRPFKRGPFARPTNLLFDISSPIFNFRNDPEDAGYKGYDLWDVYHFYEHSVLRNGFVFAHALVTNLGRDNLVLVVDDPLAVWQTAEENYIWWPRQKNEGSCELNKTQTTNPLPMFSAVELVNEFDRNSKTLGQAIEIKKIPVNGTLRSAFEVRGGTSALIRWKIDPTSNDHDFDRILRRGELPYGGECKAELAHAFRENCGSVVFDGYMAAACEGAETAIPGRYLHLYLLKEIRIDDPEDITFWVGRNFEFIDGEFRLSKNIHRTTRVIK